MEWKEEKVKSKHKKNGVCFLAKLDPESFPETGNLRKEKKRRDPPVVTAPEVGGGKMGLKKSSQITTGLWAPPSVYTGKLCACVRARGGVTVCAPKPAGTPALRHLAEMPNRQDEPLGP